MKCTLVACALALALAVTTAHAATVIVPGSVQQNPLDAAIVTTGGVAVTALIAGHRTAGGWIYNPVSAATNLCINEVGTASIGDVSGSTTCIVPGQTYNLVASQRAVSVVASDGGHAFNGYGLQ